MRLNPRTLVALALAAAAVLPAASASAMEIAAVTNPLNGCTYRVWGPDIYIQTLPKPGVQTSGGFGETVSCP
jgi:hypothetical protein